jgi:DNA-directed RNA polymerase specialized sigma subunit
VISCEPDLFPIATAGPDAIAMREANGALLASFVERLTISQQRIIFLHYDCESTFESIAAENGISVACAYRMHDRAIASLRREFEMRRVLRYSDLF